MTSRAAAVCLPDRYLLRKQAGKGGMGAVYQALDRRTRALVAIKILRSQGTVELARFDQEARVLAELSHPGIVRYLDHGVTATGTPYLAMEWLEGETLEDRLLRGTLGPFEAVRVACLVLEALAVAHARHIVHRDIKPGNIFLVGRKLDNVRLIDFGIARRVVESKRLTRSGSTVGTPLYASPEQARGRADLDGRADIFSLGCVLFEALAGEPPFSGDSPLEVMLSVCAGSAPALSAKRTGLPKALTSLVRAMLAPDPAQRPQSAAVLAGEFAEILRGLEPARQAGGQAEPLVHEAGGERPASYPSALVAMLVALSNVAKDEERARVAEVRRVLEHAGCDVDRLGDRRLLVTADLATLAEQAVRLAAAAFALRELEPAARIAIATGRATVLEGLPTGPLMDRLPALLEGQDAGTIRVDDATRRLLPTRFVVVTAQGHYCLLAGGATMDANRRHLTPVGTPIATPGQLSARPRRPSVTDG
ncbi:MAG: serine/threonine protein kinase [Deltaproteobacteria bacterium]|nr:serine/threonine protein kinase [Deltaproteobacteria bacterium]